MCVTGVVSSTVVEVQQELTTAHAELWRLWEGPRVLLLTSFHASQPASWSLYGCPQVQRPACAHCLHEGGAATGRAAPALGT